MKITNTHIHIFRDLDVPDKFLPLGLVRFLSTKFGFKFIATILNNLNPFSDKDSLDKYVQFIKIGKLGSQEKIFNECKRFYPKDTQFIVLSMDMAYMGAGTPKRDFKEQIKELGALAKKDKSVIPFIHIDPRRPEYMDLLKLSVELYGFKGVKIYNSLGYFPYDERLIPVYQYCQTHNLPIIAHCSPYNPVHFKGSWKELYALLKKSKEPIDVKGKSKKELCANFTNPKNWEYILQLFPTLNICVAHFGSEYYWERYLSNPDDKDNWLVIIKDMIEKYPRFYTDISFTLSNRDNFALLKVLLADYKLNKNILYGSDYYMVETECDERRFGLDLRAFLGEELFQQIAVYNPERFLKA